MDFILPLDNRERPDDELLADLRAVAAKAGTDQVTYRIYENLGRFGCETLRKRFGSWNRALSAAGLQISKRHVIPRDDLISELAAAWMRLGEPPSRTAFARTCTGVSASTVENRFGGWRKALEAVVEAMTREHPDDGKIAPSPPAASQISKTPRTPDLRLRWRVMQRDRFRCVKCGASPATNATVILHVDHIVPWSQNGSTVLANLQTLCEPCNLGKGTLLPADGTDSSGHRPVP